MKSLAADILLDDEQQFLVNNPQYKFLTKSQQLLKMAEKMRIFKRRIVDVQKPFKPFHEIYPNNVLFEPTHSIHFLAPDHLEEIENRLFEHNLLVDKFNITRSIHYFSKYTASFCFSFTSTPQRKSPIGSVRSRVYYQLPGICKYIDKATQKKIKSKLLGFPPHTRQILLLENLNQLLNS